MKYILLILFFFSHNLSASEVTTLFNKKRYDDVAKIYFNKEEFNKITDKEAIMVSYSLRAIGRFREDTKLLANLIKKRFSKEHQSIHELIKQKTTLDSADYPKALLVLYWNMYNDYAALIMSYPKHHPMLEKDFKYFQIFRNILSELEFREGKVEKTNDKVMSHLQYLKDIEYEYTRNWTFSYVSWQTASTITRSSTGKQIKLISTNQGICAGGDIGIENGFNYFALEGCLMAGSGGVTAYGDIQTEYQQTVAAYGLKIGPSYYRIISSSKTKIGFSIPLVYTIQNLTQPEDTDYRVKENSPLSFLPTLTARWQFTKWFVKTEFGQFIGKNEAYWSLGLGRSF